MHHQLKSTNSFLNLTIWICPPCLRTRSPLNWTRAWLKCMPALVSKAGDAGLLDLPAGRRLPHGITASTVLAVGCLSRCQSGMMDSSVWLDIAGLIALADWPAALSGSAAARMAVGWGRALPPLCGALRCDNTLSLSASSSTTFSAYSSARRSASARFFVPKLRIISRVPLCCSIRSRGICGGSRRRCREAGCSLPFGFSQVPV